MNPFDASALECALALPGAEVTLVSMGRPEVAELLHRLARLGAQRAVLLTDPLFAGSDTLATSYVLSLAAQKLRPDLILCGRQSVDSETAQVGPCLAALLGLPVVTGAMELDCAAGKARCLTRSGSESVTLPALITVERGYKLRFPSLRARACQVEVWSAEKLGADSARCGLRGSPTRVLRTYESAMGRRKCTFITPGELSGCIEQALQASRLPAAPQAAKRKLPAVWIVGPEPEEMARAVAETVRLIPRQSPQKIAALAREEKPQAILWDSGPWGRRAAPQAAALLQTGLCADCTLLETDGESLFMYRPAGGGSLTAKIVCRTSPQMATVRTTRQESGQVMVAVGAGAASALPQIRRFVRENGYSLAASRALVDQDVLPYQCQVGLTGKSVCPAVYIACGISGAVQHTCAIRQAGTVIAVNADRNARIFAYADYGIVGDCAEIFG